MGKIFYIISLLFYIVLLMMVALVSGGGDDKEKVKVYMIALMIVVPIQIFVNIFEISYDCIVDDRKKPNQQPQQ
jgi:hypothetical protein